MRIVGARVALINAQVTREEWSDGTLHKRISMRPLRHSHSKETIQ